MKRVLGLDLGSRSCGIAISDSLGIAHGREEFRFQDGAYKQCLRHIKECLDKEQVDEIALGYPLNMDGTAGESAHRSERFRDELLEMDPKLTVALVDERLTTVMATKALLEADISRNKRHKVIDQQSAIIILESYLASKQGGSL